MYLKLENTCDMLHSINSMPNPIYDTLWINLGRRMLPRSGLYNLFLVWRNVSRLKSLKILPKNLPLSSKVKRFLQ